MEHVDYVGCMLDTLMLAEAPAGACRSDGREKLPEQIDRGMNNSKVASVLQDIADMLEMKGEITFKVRAYQRAARSLEGLPVGVEQLLEQGSLREVAGIGEALENPNVDVLAHPSCRLLGERDAVAVDWEVVFQAALLTDTALEINAMPVRLDLRDIHVLRAKEIGVKLAIDTDSHSPDQLKYMRFGVSVARRGWCEAEHILNTKPLEEVRGFLKRRGSGLDRK